MSVEIQTNEYERITSFCARVNKAAQLSAADKITEREIWIENGFDADSVPSGLGVLDAWRELKEKKKNLIKVPDRGAAAVAPAQKAVPKPKSPHDTLRENRDAWWKAADRSKQLLAFETLRNADRFLKGPGKTHLGLYVAPLEHFRIEMDECVLTDERFETLRKAIFPTLDSVDKLRVRANVSAEREKRVMKNGQSSSSSSGVTGELHVAKNAKNQSAGPKHQVVMPYNYEDNGDTSEAIGTKLEGNYQMLKATWTMWKSASRSSFVEIATVDHNEISDKAHGPWPWCYDAENEPGRKDPHPMDGPFDMGNFNDEHHFSVKTGVEWVGAQYQGNVTGQRKVNAWGTGAVTPGKDKIEKNSVVAMLRSYHIRSIDAKHKYKPDFGSQLEILTLNALTGGDGFQIRDLTCFNKANRPFPGLSVPYAGLEIVKAARKAGCRGAEDMIRFYTSDGFAEDFLRRIQKGDSMTPEQKEFALYWSVGYAILVANVKAGLLLRYAIVPVTPNPQNFIIELNAKFEPTRGIVRDVGDFLLHHEIAAAYWLEDSDWSQCAGKEVPRDLSDKKFTNDLIGVEYSKRVADHYESELKMDKGILPYDTVFHVISGQKAGNILNWGNNSTFKSWGGVAWKDLGSPLNDQIMALWGALHNEVFMKDIQDKVGVDLTALRKKNQEELLPLPKYEQAEEEKIFPDLQARLASAESLALFRKHAKQMNIS